jgi:hypothetical protein
MSFSHTGFDVSNGHLTAEVDLIDGAPAGLLAIKRCGGWAIVLGPEECSLR